ncbi:hypothetical protein H7B90_20110, partial [Cohnella xylanilytica]|nr:hypothetical protein [Cohnella xylanilytica]
MLSNNLNLRKIGIILLVFSVVLTGMGINLRTPVSYAAGVVYVSNSGSDTTGDGTLDKPYATLYKAYQNVDSVGTIYVLNNIKLLADNNKKFNLNKNVTITTAPGVGTPAVIQRDQAGTSTLLDLTNGQLTLKDITIDGSIPGGGPVSGRIINPELRK